MADGGTSFVKALARRTGKPRGEEKGKADWNSSANGQVLAYRCFCPPRAYVTQGYSPCVTCGITFLFVC